MIILAGDGVTDDTNAINFMLALAASGNTESSINGVIFFPAGTYIVTGTIFVSASLKCKCLQLELTLSSRYHSTRILLENAGLRSWHRAPFLKIKTTRGS
jgi:hypothetical protein